MRSYLVGRSVWHGHGELEWDADKENTVRAKDGAGFDEVMMSASARTAHALVELRSIGGKP